MSTKNAKEDAPKYQKGNNLDYTPVTYDPQYILMVNHLQQVLPHQGRHWSADTVGQVKAVDGVTFNLQAAAPPWAWWASPAAASPPPAAPSCA